MNISCFRDDVAPRRSHTPPGDGDKTKNKEEKKDPVEDLKVEDKELDLVAESPKPQPMAFSIDFNEGKTVDMTKYENFMKRSQARHQRVQSMSASWQRPSQGNSQQQKPPMSAKLPRKAHGYHSEGYFSSDQEDTITGGSKNRQQTPNDNKKNNYNNNFSPGTADRESFRNKHLKLENYSSNSSPTAEKRNPFERSPDSLNNSFNKKSKSPIVDGIMSRSDVLPSRQGLNLPLKHPYTSVLNRTSSELMSPSYLNTQNYMLRSPYLIEQSPNDVPMLADTSSPELDLLTPDNLQITPSTPLRNSFRRNSSGHLRSFSPGPRLMNKTSPGVNLEQITRSPSVTRNIAVKTKQEIEMENNVSPSSTVSEAGTYTIEADNYTEEQKAKMNIDEIFGADVFKEPILEALGKLTIPEPVKQKFETARDYVITKEPRFASGIREELLLAKNIPDPIRKVSTDKNVLEISCCYESPTESHEPPQIVKTQKTAKSYLDKIKNRVKNISEKTFQKTPKTQDTTADFGSFTSVTASGVLSSNQKRTDESNAREKLARKNSLTKSQIDATEYIHHIPRDNLVVQAVSNESFVPKSDVGSAILSNALLNNPCIGDKVSVRSPEQILVGRLSHISLNRCQGDKSWIQEWADSVKKHNKEVVMTPKPDLALTGLPPVSPRHSVIMKGVSSPVRSISSTCSSPSKIPSPVGTLVRQRPPIPDILSSTPDTESYLASTQSVISNLQAKLQKAKSSHVDPNQEYLQILPDKCNNFTKLPVSQLSRSNSLNYRLHRRNDSVEGSPLRSPNNYYITGTQAMPTSARILLANLSASKSLDTDPRLNRSNLTSPIKTRLEEKRPDVIIGRMDIGMSKNDDIKKHSRHRSFDMRTSRDYIETFRNVNDFRNANMSQSFNADTRQNNDLFDKKDSRHRSIDQTGRMSSPSNQAINIVRSNHQRGGSDTVTQINQNKLNNKHINIVHATIQGSPIRRSSSFNVVNKNNNLYDSKNILGSPVARVSARSKNLTLSHLQGRTNTPELDYMSEDSDNLSTGGFYSDYDRSARKSDGTEILSGTRYNRAFALRRARLESPDPKLQQNVPVNSPRCPGTPEMKRKFSTEQGNQSRQRAQSRDSRRTDTVQNQQNQRGRNTKEQNKQTSANRLTRSSSTAKDFQSKSNDKNAKKPAVGVNAKDAELLNWKKRSSYDPMKAAQEGRRRSSNGKAQGTTNTNSAPQAADGMESSPVHRSRSFNCCGEVVLPGEAACQHQDVPSSDTEDDHPEHTLMSNSLVGEESLGCGTVTCPLGRSRQKQAQTNSVTISSDYITKFQVNPNDIVKRPSTGGQDSSKRRTHVIESLISDHYGGRRRTGSATLPVGDSDTATTTTNTTNGSGSDGDDWEQDNTNSAAKVSLSQITMREKSRSVPPQQRHSGDFSVSSSTTTSASKDVSAKKTGPVQPRYLDISKYKTEKSSNSNFLRRDPSKTYVAVLPSQEHRKQARRNNAKQEQEMKIKELEKWKRRASYDPRKAAAQAKTKPAGNKSPSSSVLRSQSFHGPMTQNTKLSTGIMDRSMGSSFYQDASSDNEF